MDSPSESQYMSSSHSSINHPRKQKQSSEISKTYKHASQLYLTRRLAEAYEALLPIITHPERPQQSNGHHSGDESPSLAPIATANTSQRIKIWSLYVTLLNAIVDLGAEPGKQEMGQKQYRDIVKAVQSGQIWEQVVRDGYRGRESSVDAEVVYNLSTLLLGQAPDQVLNQSRLETYLSSSPQPIDISAHLNHSLSNGNSSQLNGASTPKDLASRTKIIELFTLHVLPANSEWDYARSFISNSHILDEERREAFFQTLSELQEAKEQEEALTEDESFEDAEEEVSSSPQQNGFHKGHQRTSSEVDYGIDQTHPNGSVHSGSQPPPTPRSPPPPSSNNISSTTDPKALPPLTSLPPRPEPDRHPSAHLSPPAQTPRRPPTRRSKAQAQNTLLSQARHLFVALSNLTRNITGSMFGNPTAVFRMLLFLVAFLMAFSRREVRERIRRVMEGGWDKVRRTVGMGVKVSYI